MMIEKLSIAGCSGYLCVLCKAEKYILLMKCKDFILKQAVLIFLIKKGNLSIIYFFAAFFTISDFTASLFLQKFIQDIIIYYLTVIAKMCHK